MDLKVIGSGSSGNAYLLENEEEALLIECGMKMKDILIALKFKLHKLTGCLVSHEHFDHSKSVKELLDNGITVFATAGTHEACGTLGHHNAEVVACSNESIGHKYHAGGFCFKSFKVVHDAKEPCGFVIDHKETGKVLFLTDSMYSSYTFKGINNMIVECNFSEKIIKERLSSMQFLRDRILNSHMSLETCIQFIKETDTTALNNIVLIHLSDGNSHERMFKQEITKLTGKNVTVASNGLVLNLNKRPF